LRSSISTNSPFIFAHTAKTLQPNKSIASAASSLISQNLMWSYFIFTGAPYRAYLFRVGRRTQYWIIYTVDDESRTVNVIHFWNATRDPEVLEL
jgi:hypothetical protein